MSDRPVPSTRYDWTRTYAWNYEHPPAAAAGSPVAVPGTWDYCGLAVNSPLGIAAGPLLNGQWCLYYAGLGFDILTYKTVRSRPRGCYDLPNLLPVRAGQLAGGERDLAAQPSMEGSWAVSFGMPSASPDVWRADVERTRASLTAGKLLVVSVVGTVQPGWTTEELADDYAQCAAWAVDSGADVVEANFSCPNVTSCDGQLFQTLPDARVVAERIRERIPNTPLVLKIGHLPRRSQAAELVRAVDGLVSGLAMTNSIAATVVDAGGKRFFDGHPRGICGSAILSASLRQVGMFAELIEEAESSLRIVGVGGISAAQHVRSYLAAGAHAVQLATAVMVHPEIGLAIRQELAQPANITQIPEVRPPL